MKIRIPIPPKELNEYSLEQAPHFSTSLTLRVGDMNYGNHMGNDTVLSLAHEFRIRFFHQYLQNELSFFKRGIIMSDSAIQYRAQGFWAQEIKANLWFIPTGSTRFDIYYQLQSPKDKPHEDSSQQWYDVAYVKTGQVFFDYEKQKVSSPQDQGLQEYQSFLTDLGISKLL